MPVQTEYVNPTTLEQPLEEYIEGLHKQADKAKAPKAKPEYREFRHHCGFMVRVYQDGRIEYPPEE